jgi:DNA-binding NarL/FixJ family response regulator
MGMKPLSPYQIILADDHLMFRSGIKRIIEDAKNLLVIGEAGDGLQLLKLVKKNKKGNCWSFIHQPTHS